MTTPYNVIILLALVARIASPLSADFSYLILAVYALLGRHHIVQALALSWLFTMINPALVPDAAYASFGRHVVLFSCTLSVLLRSSFARINRLVFVTVLLAVFIVLHSLAFSVMSDVSIMKAVAWIMTMFTLLTVWNGLNNKQRDELRRWLFIFFVLIAVSSLPFITVPSIGYLRNGTGFQGIMNHPQAFGSFMTLLTSWALGLLISQRHSPLWLYLLVIGGILLIVLTQSRVGIVALVLALFISMVLVNVLSGKTVSFIMPVLRSKRFAMISVTSMVVVALFYQQLGSTLTDYMLKNRDASQFSNIFEIYQNSREKLYLPMLENISINPWTGIGFGIASDPYSMYVKRDQILELPISAPVEKGVIVLAILEEVGIPGFLFVVIWVWMLLRRAAINGVVSVIVLSCMFLLNMVEMVLFSSGGLGLIFMILLSSEVSKPKQFLGPVSLIKPIPAHA